jgi:hypothetical protein
LKTIINWGIFELFCNIFAVHTFYESYMVIGGMTKLVMALILSDFRQDPPSSVLVDVTLT